MSIKISDEKCKVIGCDNRVMTGLKKVHPLMEGTYGYCQIHQIEGLVKEISQ